MTFLNFKYCSQIARSVPDSPRASNLAEGNHFSNRFEESFGQTFCQGDKYVPWMNVLPVHVL
jgi:hypothetical protein